MNDGRVANNLEDAALLLDLAILARSGDKLALAELVQRTRLSLFAIAYAELRNYDDAHDAVATALLQVCRHIQSIRQPEAITAWMRSIVRNEVRGIRRASNAECSASMFPLLDMDASTFSFVHESQLRLDIEQAMRQLSTPQEQAIRLFYFAGLAVQEIGERLQVQPATVRQWLHRGRERLASNLKGYETMATSSPEQLANTPSHAALSAGILHSELSPELIRSLSDALSTGGYRVTFITPAETEQFSENLRGLIEYVTDRGKDLLIFDEQIGGRSALEYVINLRGPRSQRTNIPFCVLSSGGRNYFAAAAFFAAGVDRVLRKDSPDEIAAFAAPFRSSRPQRPIRFTETFRAATKRASEEAARRGVSQVDTAYALWGMLSDSAVPPPAYPAVDHLSKRLGIPASQINDALSEILPQPQSGFDVAAFLDARFGIAKQQIVGALEARMPRYPEPILEEAVTLSDDLKDAIDHCPEEYALVSEGQELNDGVRGVGVEHLFLSILRIRHGSGSHLLAELGVTLDAARASVRDWLEHHRDAPTEPK